MNFQCEAIPTFCCIRGMTGHGENFCDRVFDILIESTEKPYGPWLRADMRRKTHTIGAKWFRSGGGVQARNSGDSGGGVADKVIPGKDALVQQTS